MNDQTSDGAGRIVGLIPWLLASPIKHGILCCLPEWWLLTINCLTEPLDALVAFYSVSLNANPTRVAAFMNKLRIPAPSKAKGWPFSHVNEIIDECADFWDRVSD